MNGNTASQSLTIPRMASEENVKKQKKRGCSQEKAGLAWLGALNLVLFALLFLLLYKGLHAYTVVGF